MTFGGLFVALLWLLTVATVIGCLCAAAVLLRRHEDGVEIGFGVGSLICGVLIGVAALALWTGEWKVGGILPDGCYRVGHEVYLSGKTTGVRNTFEPLADCR